MGKVQQVGFRLYVKSQAEKLNIKGEVWNRMDGAVEIVAISESESAMESFVLSLSDGPGWVQRVMSDLEPEPQSYSGFHVGISR